MLVADLTARLNDIKAEMDTNRTLAQQHGQAVTQLNANYNALEGAKQETLNWLQKIEEAAKAVETVAAVTGHPAVATIAGAVESLTELVDELTAK